MKIILDVPGSTIAVSVVICYYSKHRFKNGLMMHNKLLVTDELKDGEVYTFEEKEGNEE